MGILFGLYLFDLIYLIELLIKIKIHKHIIIFALNLQSHQISSIYSWSCFNITSNNLSKSDVSMNGTNCSNTKFIELLKNIGAFVNKLINTSTNTCTGFFMSSGYSFFCFFPFFFSASTTVPRYLASKISKSLNTNSTYPHTSDSSGYTMQ